MNKTTSYKAILTLAIPAIISGISEPLIGSTDLVLLGNYTKNGIAVMGIGGSAILSLIWLLSSFFMPVSARIAHLFGAGKTDQLHTLTNYLLKRVVVFSVVISLLLYLFSEQIISFYNSSDAEINKEALSYFQIRLIGLPFLLFSIFCFQIFRGLQNTTIALVVTLVGGFVNLCLDFILIKGLYGFPQLGIAGASIASTVSHVVMAIGTLVYFYRFGLFNNKNPTTIYLKLLFSNSLNLFLRTLLLNACILIGNRITTKQGGAYIEVHTIMANLFILIAYFMDGIAHATTAIIGKLKGQNQLGGIRKVAFRGVFLNLLVGFVYTFLIFVFSAGVVSFYSPKISVLELFIDERILFLLTVFIGSIAFTFDGIYIGLENTVFLRNSLLVATLIGYFPTLLISQNYTLHGIWVALLVWMILRSGIPFFHFLMNKKIV